MTRNPCNKKDCLVGGCSPQKQLIPQSIKLLWWNLICLHLVCNKIVLQNLQRLLPKLWDAHGWSCLMCLRFSMVFQWCYFHFSVVLGRHHTLLGHVCCIATWASISVPYRIPYIFTFPQLVWTSSFLLPRYRYAVWERQVLTLHVFYDKLQNIAWLVYIMMGL